MATTLPLAGHFACPLCTATGHPVTPHIDLGDDCTECDRCGYQHARFLADVAEYEASRLAGLANLADEFYAPRFHHEGR